MQLLAMLYAAGMQLLAMLYAAAEPTLLTAGCSLVGYIIMLYEALVDCCGFASINLLLEDSCSTIARSLRYYCIYRSIL